MTTRYKMNLMVINPPTVENKSDCGLCVDGRCTALRQVLEKKLDKPTQMSPEGHCISKERGLDCSVGAQPENRTTAVDPIY